MPMQRLEQSVRMAESPLHGGRSGRGEPRAAAPGRDVAAADTLLAQSRPRVVAALLVALVQLALVLRQEESGRALGVLVVVLGYALAVGVIAARARRAGRLAPRTITAALLADLGFIHGMTAAGTTPAHYERALFGTIVVVHVANFYFGRRQGRRVLYAGIGGYLALIGAAAMRGLAVDLLDELWSLALAGLGAVLILSHGSDVRRRLRILVELFERVEEGDFTRAYDDAADGRADAITRVGRAYNRVRVQLASMVLTDPLTGCLNRRGFDQALAREQARARRAGSTLALLAIDLDHFKSVNDTYGHLAGDQVLRATGELLRQAGRAGDVVARVGGDEFAFLLPDTSSSGAFLFASRLCDLVRGHPFDAGNGRVVQMTASVGVVADAPEGSADFADVLSAHADAALYSAKRSGRDRVRAWSPEIGAELEAERGARPDTAGSWLATHG